MLKNSPNLGPFPGKSGKKSPAGTQVRRKTPPFRGGAGGILPVSGAAWKNSYFVLQFAKNRRKHKH